MIEISDRYNMRTLIVEDSQAVRETVADILQFFNYEVLCAASAEDALALLDTQKFRVALLISDVILPGLDGRRLWKRVQARHSGCKGLLISAYLDETIPRDVDNLSGATFLQKPFSLEQLMKSITGLFPGNQSNQIVA